MKQFIQNLHCKKHCSRVFPYSGIYFQLTRRKMGNGIIQGCTDLERCVNAVPESLCTICYFKGTFLFIDAQKMRTYFRDANLGTLEVIHKRKN